ncbi:hypothetical protein L9F63_025800 [Diploptera punctata]|uniref:Uncharacterized protein n=1 Tax=Diploptera punctata TaxID=6984 RepID=A0AAD8E2V5_DIPPU|nr:hypothetical protein L9F63_025800 [Diploptera punctata]
MSRINLERQLPRTNQLLRSLSAVQMLGYNKVGEDTFENVIPFLTGLNIPELKLLCWPNVSSPFDDCPFIWKKFSDAGYITAFADDASDVSMFNRGKKGFLKPPTDYYLRPYFLFGDHIFSSPSEQCYGNQLKTEKLLEYVSKFIIMKKKKYFGVFWETNLTHNELNYPEIADEMLYNFINSIKSQLNNTVLIFMSDHGTRIGEFVETYQGYLENRLPLLSFMFPKWFQENYKLAMKNLKENTRLLSTHFDLHETLLDMLDLTSIEDGYLKVRMNKNENKR